VVQSTNVTLSNTHHSPLPKTATGIRGLDEITGGGLPTGRPTLICGGPGCGKTLFGIEFLVRGALDFNEPGVFLSFEELPEDLAANVQSLGYDLTDLEARGLLSVDHVRVERNQIEETGDYDLEGLFVRLGFAIDSIGAKRVVLDTIESLFSGLGNAAIVRAELRRLFFWLKDRGVTAIVTGERGEGQLTRQGLEEYVSDCVILLDQRVTEQLSTRRLRIVKYRGSSHGTNEFPFLIDDTGITIMPITSASLDHRAWAERLPSGVSGLDEMLGGGGYFRASSVLITGTAGSGKTSLAGFFAAATARAGKKGLYFSFEESPAEIIRNLRSIGLDLEPYIADGSIRIVAVRPSLQGFEAHLTAMHRQIEEFRPDAVVIDPVSNFISTQSRDVNSLMVRVLDRLKAEGVTCMMTSLSHSSGSSESTEEDISSIVDAWVLLRMVEEHGERNRLIYVLKSRGMAHSNALRPFLMTSSGIEIGPVSRRTNGSAQPEQAAAGGRIRHD
jgi:circadian clock protein KaiC